MSTIGLTLLTLGVLALAISIRGRVVAKGRFCRRCRFDLGGLTDPAACPECGFRHGASTRPRTSLRRKRPVELAAGGLGVLAGCCLLALANARPSAWYPRLPEPVLMAMDGLGVNDAFIEAHARLMAGTLSEPALRRLIDRSMAMTEPPAERWEHARGDVLAVALQKRLLDDEQAAKLAERSFLGRIEIRPIQPRSEGRVRFRVVITGNPSTASALAPSGAARRGALPSPYSIGLDYTMWIDSASHGIRPSGGGRMTPFLWLPSEALYMDTLTGTWLPDDGSDTANVHGSLNFTLYRDNEEIHQWEQTVAAGFTRSESAPPMTVNTLADDKAAQRAYAKGLALGFVSVPVRRDEGRRRPGTENGFGARTIRLWADRHRDPNPDPEPTLLFDLFLRLDDDEIFFASYHGSRLDVAFTRTRQDDQSTLDYFDRHAAFWERAIARGSVDVLLRPNGSLAARDPRYRRHAGVSVIFRGVPLMILLPEDTGRRSPGGTTWAWVQEDPKPYQLIPGAVFEE